MSLRAAVELKLEGVSQQHVAGASCGSTPAAAGGHGVPHGSGGQAQPQELAGVDATGRSCVPERPQHGAF